MSAEKIKCVLLADRRHGLTEGIRDLPGTTFEAGVNEMDLALGLQLAQSSRGCLEPKRNDFGGKDVVGRPRRPLNNNQPRQTERKGTDRS